MSWIKNPEKLLKSEEKSPSRKKNKKLPVDKNEQDSSSCDKDSNKFSQLEQSSSSSKKKESIKTATKSFDSQTTPKNKENQQNNHEENTDRQKDSSKTSTSSVQQKKDKNSTSDVSNAHNTKKSKDTSVDSISWVKNPKNLLQSDQNPSNCKKSKNNDKQILPKASSHASDKNQLLHLDIISEVIEKMKSNTEFKNLLESVSAIMTDKNLKNRKFKINMLESFLENYKSANEYYMKELQTIVNDCESQMALAPLFMDVKDDVTLTMGGSLHLSAYLSPLPRHVHKGVITKDNVKKEVLMKTDNALLIQNEAWVLKQLKHPNIIGLLGYDPHHKIIILEYMDRFDMSVLHELGERAYILSTHVIKTLFFDIITGMEYVHSKKILHRNLKLKHIFFNANYECKISGFKNAVYVGDSNGEYESSVLSHPCAPEYKATGKYTYKTDVWSVGVIFHDMLITICRSRGTLHLGDPIMQLKNFVIEKMLACNPHDRMDCSEIKIFIQNIAV